MQKLKYLSSLPDYENRLVSNGSHEANNDLSMSKPTQCHVITCILSRKGFRSP